MSEEGSQVVKLPHLGGGQGGQGPGPPSSFPRRLFDVSESELRAGQDPRDPGPLSQPWQSLGVGSAGSLSRLREAGLTTLDAPL